MICTLSSFPAVVKWFQAGNALKISKEWFLVILLYIINVLISVAISRASLP